MAVPYEVILGPAALRLLLSLTDSRRLADALAVELASGPNANKELRFDGDAQVWLHPAIADNAIYTATPLSVDGYTALHRRLSANELERLRHERGVVAEVGVYVIDILPAEAAFSRRPRLR
jgi:hypothetical protein